MPQKPRIELNVFPFVLPPERMGTKSKLCILFPLLLRSYHISLKGKYYTFPRNSY